MIAPPAGNALTSGDKVTDLMSDLLDLYFTRDYALKPVPAGSKRPIRKGWPDQEFGPEDFDKGSNVAVQVGRRSGNLADCDLDSEEAIELAPLYLLETGAIFGRKSKSRSHWLYIAENATFETFIDPIAQQTLLELRSDGRDGGAHLTLVPPSIANGEPREWCSETIEPAVFNGRALRMCMARLAIGCLTMRYVSEYAARRPGPDLLNILWEFDRELGRPAYRWLGEPTPDAPRWTPKPRQLLSDRESPTSRTRTRYSQQCRLASMEPGRHGVLRRLGGFRRRLYRL